MAERANHYVLNGYGVAGTVDTSSISGRPVGSFTVDSIDAENVEIELGPLGWAATGELSATDDGDAVSVTIIVPEVNVVDGPERFRGFAVVVTQHSSIGGPGLVRGALSDYDIRNVAGTADTVEF